jgi:hypothetical protein
MSIYKIDEEPITFQDLLELHEAIENTAVLEKRSGRLTLRVISDERIEIIISQAESGFYFAGHGGSVSIERVEEDGDWLVSREGCGAPVSLSGTTAGPSSASGGRRRRFQMRRGLICLPRRLPRHAS